ncbi:hypothetical protein MHYP_G00221620, partial [Metynnis hypsauchen]
MSNWPNCMSLDCGRKPENPKETHADTGRTCKLHIERTPVARPGNRTQALLAVRRQRYPPRHRDATSLLLFLDFLLPLDPFPSFLLKCKRRMDHGLMAPWHKSFWRTPCTPIISNLQKKD